MALVLDGLSKGLLPLLTCTLMDMSEVGSCRMGLVAGLFFAIEEVGGFGGPFVIGLLRDLS